MLKIWDADNFRRTLAGLCLIAAPLVLLVALLVHPGEGGDGFVQTIADNPGRVEMSNLLIIFSSVLFVPALLGVLRLIRERGVVLAHVGIGLALIGVIGHAVWAGFQIVLVGTITGGIDQTQMSEMVEGGPPNAGFVVVMLMFLVGFFLGLVVLAAGLWRSRAVPWWAALCLIAAAVWDFVPFGSGIVAAATGPVFALVGSGAVGLKILTMSDADWRQGRAPSTESVGIGAQPRVQ